MVEADIFSIGSLKTHFQGQDVIMSCLGFPASIFSGVTGYTLSMNAVISAMREARVSRIITMTSWYTERKRRSKGSSLMHDMMNLIKIRPAKHQHVSMVMLAFNSKN